MTAPSNANTSGLAPCPFCGGAPSVRQAMGETWVVCGSCSASTQSKGRETVAFDLWNRRAAPASPLPGGGDMDWQSVAMWMGFSASVIKNGEPWSDQCQQHYDEAKAAFARLAAPTGDAT